MHSEIGESYSNRREENCLSTLHLGQFPLLSFNHLPETSLHKSPISSGHISKNRMLGSQSQEKI